MDASEMPQRETGERVDGDDAPVGGGAPAPAGPLGPGRRWSVARKRAVVLRLIAGEPVREAQRVGTSRSQPKWKPVQRASVVSPSAAQVRSPTVVAWLAARFGHHRSVTA